MISTLALTTLLLAAPVGQDAPAAAPAPRAATSSDPPIASSGLAVVPARLDLGTVARASSIGSSVRLVNTSPEPITAEKALEYGMVARVAEPGKAVDEAIALATRIAKNAPLSVAASKQLIVDSFGRTEEEFWKHQIPQMAAVFASDDAKEGPRSFAEKRAPKWSGS